VILPAAHPARSGDARFSFFRQFSSRSTTMQSVWEQLSREISERVAQAGRSIVAVDGRGGHTSAGIVWRPDLVLTAAHSIRPEVNVGNIAIIWEPGKSVRARLVGRASGAGIALLKLEETIQAPAAGLGSTGSPAIGELVVAVARTRRGNIVASSGILGGLMGEWAVRGVRIDQFIRPDLTLYPGFSGGGLIGSSGGFLGMNTAGLVRGKAITIPASTLTRIAEELLAKGHTTTPYVGILMQPISIDESLQKRSGVKAAGGLLVMHAEPGGPADAGGVLVGDILVDLDGHATDDTEQLQDVLRQRGVDQEVKVGLIRGGQKMELAIKIGARPVR
jgi:S1-C subfamily serine protease